jgi:4-diphosphocytidyl-2-C-methyl-D-erythritol kinase
MITVQAPAKVNLQLAVGPKRADGFHELATVFHAVDVMDRIHVRANPLGAGITIDVIGKETQGVPADETNLAAQAVLLLAQRAQVPADVHLTIEKFIPVAGGMAGGSADAAAALIGADALFGMHMSRDELDHVAAQLGSDVPFALHGGTMIGTGRGEQLLPVLTTGTLHWVFALVDDGLSTPAVYTQCDDLREGIDVAEPAINGDLLIALRSGDYRAIASQMSNDLQPAALTLRPDLGQLIEAGIELGAITGIVSGSGPTCAFLVWDSESALDLAVALTSTGLCRDVRRAQGPVAGARIITP